MDLLTGSILAKLGDHVDTDVMTPGKYLTSYEPEYLGSICMIDAEPGFPQKMAPGGFVVAGFNFGCGSSRETAPIALKAAGAKAIIAEEFSRIFYRNALNIGLPCVICPGISSCCEEGDELEIDLLTGCVRNITQGKTMTGSPIPRDLLEQFSAGGLIAYLKAGLQKK